MNSFMILQQRGFLMELSQRYSEGGMFFMILITVCLLLSFLFLTLGFINIKKEPKVSMKMLKITSDISLLGLVIGFLGSIIGLITAFDTIESINNIPSASFSKGLKVSFLTTLLGSITFIFPRIGIIILRFFQKSE